MTVKELIDILSQFDSDDEVVVGMKQRYGSNFMMEVANVDKREVDPFDYDYEDDEPVSCVVITQGSDIGTVCYELEDSEFFD